MEGAAVRTTTVGNSAVWTPVHNGSSATRDRVRGSVGTDAEILEHCRVSPRYMRITLRAPGTAADAVPGQFVMISISERTVPVLPRPMAIYSVERETGSVTIVYAVVGRGTRMLAERRVGESVYILGPLGRGFEMTASTRSMLLVGRGIGTCSLTTVAQYAAEAGIRFRAVVSARNDGDLVGLDLYRRHGAEEVIAISDERGDSDPELLRARLVSSYAETPPDLILTCGSRRLADLCGELADQWGSRMQVSLEARMACGLGFCHGCAHGEVGGADESPLVCMDGPVFDRSRNPLPGRC